MNSTEAIHPTRGVHIIAEFSGCTRETLADGNAIAGLLAAAAEKAGASVLETSLHKFGGGGVSGAVLIAESHLSVHTWPELGYAACDFYTCGEHTRPESACRWLAVQLGALKSKILTIKRGIGQEDGTYSFEIEGNG